jgi:two-component system LytT family response regulator
MIRIAICDDEHTIVKKLENIVHDYDSRKHSQFEIHTFSDGIDLISSKLKFDLIFLDIEMPNIDGIKAAKKIREKDKNVRFVYVTSHSECALNVFAVHPFDFAVKPVDANKIHEILSEYIEYSRQRDFEEKVTLKTTSGTIVLNLKNVVAFEYTDNRRILVHTADKIDEIRGSITEILKTISSEHFVSPHKSFIVNLREVNKIADFTIFMSNGLKIPVAQKRLKEFQTVLSLYMHKYLIQE